MVSPIIRPAAENTPNLLGATQADLRSAIEQAVQATGDGLTSLVPGRNLVDPEMLVDGIHPNDAGHRLLAQAMGTVLYDVMGPPCE